MLSKERQNAILDYITKKPAVSVAELSAAFDVSAVTIRKDLNELSIDGKIERTHGGAIPLQKSSFESTLDISGKQNIESKQQVALKAVKLVEPGSTIMIDAGSTTLELAKLIEKSNIRDLTIITHAMNVANLFANNEHYTLIVVGGVYRPGIMSNVGPYAVEQMKKLFADRSFIGINGYTLDEGLTTHNPYEAEIKKTLIRRSKESILLADSSKFGTVCMSKVVDLTDLYGVVSDDGLSVSARQVIQGCGLKLY